MNWYMEYKSVYDLPHEYIMFLCKFNSMGDFHTYCMLNLPEDYFLINEKLSIEKVLKDLKCRGKF